MKPINVLHFVSQGTLGGQERAQYQLLKAFVGNPEVNVGAAIIKDQGIYIDYIRDLGIPLVYLNISDGFHFKFKRDVINKFKDFEIHHLHDPSPNIILYSLLAGKSVKRVFTRRGGIALYSSLNFKKKLKFHIKKFLLNQFFQGFSGNSKNAVDSVRTQYGVRNKDISLLYNGIDFNLLKPTCSEAEVKQELSLNGRHFLVGATGRLVGWKRFDLLIRAFSKTNIPDKKLIIVGKGPDLSNLKKLVDNLGLNESVILPGEVKDVANYLQILDCFVLPSDNRESFGNSVVEAMYFEVPSIIMADSSGLGEHITDRSTGLIAKDEDDLTSTIEYVYQQKSALESLTKRGKDYVVKKYSYDNMVRNYQDYYSTVISNHN